MWGEHLNEQEEQLVDMHTGEPEFVGVPSEPNTYQ